MRMNAILNPARPARPLAVALLCGAGAVLIAGAGFAAQSAAAQAAAAQPEPAPAPKTVTIVSSQPTVTSDGKNETITLSVDGDVVDAKGKRIHLKGKPVTLVVDARDAEKMKTMHVTGVVDADKDLGGQVKIDGTVALGDFTVKAKDGKTFYILSPAPPAPQAPPSPPSAVEAPIAPLPPPTAPTPRAAPPAPAPAPQAAPAPEAKSHSKMRFVPASPDGGSVDLEADVVKVDKGRSLSIYSGNPTIRVVRGKDADAKAVAYQLNGRPAPADFDPAVIPAGQLDRIEVHRGPPGIIVNLVTRTPAG